MSEYRHRKHMNAVLGGSNATYAAWAVLEAMVRLAEFDRPEVTVTKSQLMDEAKRSWPRIKIALKILREEGSIEPIKNILGGRGNATTYRLCVIGQGSKSIKSTPKVEGEASVWGKIAAEYRATDEAIYKAWIHKLDFVRNEDGQLTLAAPTNYHATYVKTHLADNLLSIASGHDQSIKRINILEP